MLVPLRHSGPQHGGKAAWLGRAVRSGYPVPDGLVVPADLPVHELGAALPRWVDRTTVAVRSSATAEDGAARSAAGIFDSVLGVRGRAAVVEAVTAVRASLDTARSRAYGVPADAAMHVVVQRQVDPDVGGVLVTQGSRVVIEHVHGHPHDVVAGTTTPVRFVGTVAEAGWLAPVAALGSAIAHDAGHDVDIEWAVEGDRVWLLQVRPLTATVHVPGTTDPAAAGAAGTGASAGTATGPARVVGGPEDFARVRPGDVLVCRTTDPAWTPLLGVVAAVVTEVGGVLSHAAIVARERGIPAVVGLDGARARFRDGRRVAVDGTAGTVRALDETP